VTNKHDSYNIKKDYYCVKIFGTIIDMYIVIFINVQFNIERLIIILKIFRGNILLF